MRFLARCVDMRDDWRIWTGALRGQGRYLHGRYVWTGGIFGPIGCLDKRDIWNKRHPDNTVIE